MDCLVKFMVLCDYPENVNNKETFIIFVKELIKERGKAEKLEKENSDKYKFYGALGWENATIGKYLDCAVS